jgi:hypothetical protein
MTLFGNLVKNSPAYVSGGERWSATDRHELIGGQATRDHKRNRGHTTRNFENRRIARRTHVCNS